MSAAIKPGDLLTTRSICNYDCIYSIRILKRTAKRATFSDYRGGYGATRTSKIHTDQDGSEYLRPDRWSMAPTFRAIFHAQEAA